MALAADFKAPVRNVRRGGWLSITIVIVLALAMGAVTAIFSIAHAVLIRPLPVAEPDRVRPRAFAVSDRDVLLGSPS